MLGDALRAHLADAVADGGADTGAGGGNAGAPGKASSGRKQYPTLMPSHFAAQLDSDEIDIDKTMALFDANGDGKVERSEFISAIETLYTNWRTLKASLDGQQSVSTALTWLLDLVFWCIFAVAALYLLDVPVDKVFVPLGTILVSASFAIGSSLANVVNSLIFVLVTRPYHVGDRVTCSGVFDGQETLIVRRIDVLNTEFLRFQNKSVLVPNHLLIGQVIENFKRSPPAALKVEVLVSNTTTAAQLESLRLRMNAYLLTQPLVWKPGTVIRMAGFRDQSLNLSLWFQSFLSWNDTARLFKGVTALYFHLLGNMRDIGISFKGPEQRLHVDGNLGVWSAQGPPAAAAAQGQGLHHAPGAVAGGVHHMPPVGGFPAAAWDGFSLPHMPPQPRQGQH